jgi:serpin B
MRNCLFALLASTAACKTATTPAAEPQASMTATTPTKAAISTARATSEAAALASGPTTATPTTSSDLTLSVPATNAPPGSGTSSAAVNAFALQLFAASRATPGNTMQSAYSARSALMMVALGAQSATYAELSKALRLPATTAELVMLAQRDARDLEAARSTGAQFRSANNVYVDNSFALKPDYADAVARGFGVKAENLDFLHASEGARGTINSWVAASTRDKIQELLPAGGVDATTRLVLANAVHFHASWATAFDAKDTKNAPWFGAEAAVTQAATMNRTGSMRYAATQGMQVVELPYANSSLVMDVLLPNDRSGLSQVERSLSAASLDRSFAGLSAHDVALALPKFGLNNKAELTPVLKGLGIQQAFGDNANFNGISEGVAGRKLFVKKVYHQTFIQVDEQGTEAAGATAVATGYGGGPRTTEVVKVDHPFLFFIRDSASGKIYFMGRVTNPTTN